MLIVLLFWSEDAGILIAVSLLSEEETSERKFVSLNSLRLISNRPGSTIGLDTASDTVCTL